LIESLVLIGGIGFLVSGGLFYKDWVMNSCHGFCEGWGAVVEEVEGPAMVAFVVITLWGLGLSGWA